MLDEYELDKEVIFTPEFARPQFDYRPLSGMIINKESRVNAKCYQAFLNTFNFCINRDEYLEVYEYTKECKSADSIYFNYLWLKSGRYIFVVPGLQYDHKVHPNSTFKKEFAPSIKMANIYLDKINRL